MTTCGRGKKVLSEVLSEDEPTIHSDVKIVVLINRNSASASEIMAGCLQDHHRATVIGEQSWGKGTVQKVIRMKQGRAALKLTTSSYWRPSGKHIDRYDEESLKTKKWGVRPGPEFVVSMTEAEVISHLKQMQNREIRGLIPSAKQDQLMQLATERFKQAMQDNVEQDVESDEQNDGSPPSMEIVKPIDVDEIESLNLDHDAVLEKAIEFLTRPAITTKIAA